MRRFALVAVGFVFLAGVTATASGGAAYVEARRVITDLGTLGGDEAQAEALSDRGQIVGWADIRAKTKDGESIHHAFLWQSGRMRDLGTLGGPESSASDVNERGQVVGWADTRGKTLFGEPATHAFLWQNGQMRDLGTLGGPESSASSVNDRGQVVGWANTTVKENDGRFYLRHAFLWQTGKMRDLGTLGGPESSALAINEHGWVVGSADTRVENKDWGILSPVEHAYLWRAGRIRDLGMARGKRSTASDINDRGQIVGSLDTGRKDAESKYGDEPIWHALLWQTGRLRDLTPRGPYSFAGGINGRGQIVGSVTALGENQAVHPVLWTNGKRIELGSLRFDSEAVAINDRGHVVGWGLTRDWNRRAVLWTLRRGG